MNQSDWYNTLPKHPWPRNTAAGRWYGFGRYLAMLPPPFIFDVVNNFTWPDEVVLDPFCGRGNVPFTASVLGRRTVGIDINPVAWIFTEVKLHPVGSPERVIRRLEEIGRARRPQDRRGRNRFETMAWAPDVRALLKVARRELDWMGSEIDRTLMAFVALHVQDKLGSGLSNAMSPTISYSPAYAVRWWTDKGLLKAPEIDPVAMLTDKIIRRYECGVPEQAEGTGLLGDAREKLSVQESLNAALLMTSPPYRGVADYWNDYWIRLWLLGYEFRKDWQKAARFENKTNYRHLIQSVFQESSRHLTKDAAILVRSDQRRQTADLCVAALREVWPERSILVRLTMAPHKSVSVHHGHGGTNAKEIDLLLPSCRGGEWWRTSGFVPVEDSVYG